MVREPGMCLSRDQYHPPGWIVAIISSVKVVSNVTWQAFCEGNYRACFHNLRLRTDHYSYFKSIIMLLSESWAVYSCSVQEARVSNNKDIKINWHCFYPIWSGTYTLFVTWGDRDLLNSPYPVIIRDGSEIGDAAAAAGGMNAHQNYNLSSYREQHSSSNTSQQQQKGMCEPWTWTTLISPALGYVREYPRMHHLIMLRPIIENSGSKLRYPICWKKRDLPIMLRFLTNPERGFIPPAI